MGNDNISLDAIYQKKRDNAQRIADENREKIYSKLPKVQELERSINMLAISTTKSMIYMDIQEKETKKKELEKEICKIRKEINDLLEKNGYHQIDMEPQYSCKICQDKGFYVEDSVTHTCNCYKQAQIQNLLKHSNLNNLDKENFTTFDLGYFSNKIDEKKYLSKISPRDNITRIKEKSVQFIDNFNNPDTKNLMFLGTAGLGKTFLSNCIANEIINSGHTVIYQTAPLLMDKVIDSKFNRNDDSTDKDFVEEILNVDLLIIDDLGTEKLNDYKYQELFNIINSRILENKKIIISTNLTLNDLQERYDSRIVSRVIGEFDNFRFFGEDIRIVKRKMQR